MFCRSLGLCYPHFPTEKEFIHSVLSSSDVQSHSQGGDLYLLGRFAQEWPQLQAGGQLLPDLVEFYQWLHTALGESAISSPYSSVDVSAIAGKATPPPNIRSLAHLVTYEQATTLRIDRVVQLAARMYDKEMEEQLKALYHRVKGQCFCK